MPPRRENQELTSPWYVPEVPIVWRQTDETISHSGRSSFCRFETCRFPGSNGMSSVDPTAGIFNNGSQAEMGFGMVDDWSPTHSLSSEACSSRCLALRPMPTWRSTVVVYFTSSLTTLMQEAKLRPLPVPLRTLLVPIRVPCHKLNIYYGIVSYRM